jgi:hypothetical protein
MIEDFAKLVPPHLDATSGSVFYSGRDAFRGPSPIYVLGLNPGGDPESQAGDTVGKHVSFVIDEAPAQWSAYSDESWLGKPPGTAKLQRRVRHLLRQVGLDPRTTPSSNLIFARSQRISTLQGGVEGHEEACWAFHKAVIDQLGVRLIVCLGVSTGDAVRRRTGAERLLAQFRENNRRGWVSSVHGNCKGLSVASLTHPSIADWTTTQCDPSELLLRQLA